MPKSCSEWMSSVGQKEYLQVFSPVNDQYWRVLDCLTFKLANESQVCDEEVMKHVSKWARWLQVQIKKQKPNHMDHVSFKGILSAPKQCDITPIYKGAEIWLLQHFMKPKFEEAMMARTSLKPESAKEIYMEIEWTKCSKVLNHLREEFPTSEEVMEADNDILSFTQLTYSTPLEFADAFWLNKSCNLPVLMSMCWEETLLRHYWRWFDIVCQHTTAVMKMSYYKNWRTKRPPPGWPALTKLDLAATRKN